MRDSIKYISSQVESRVGGALMAAAPTIFDIVKNEKAADVVAEVAALPKFPSVRKCQMRVDELREYGSHRATQGTLVAANRDSPAI
jgi:hypothetical protein